MCQAGSDQLALRKKTSIKMTEAIITLLVAATSTVITAVVTWLFAKKKSMAETRLLLAKSQKTELETIEDAVKIWRELAEDLKKEVQRLSADNKALKTEVGRLLVINNLILEALDRITKDNIETIVKELKKDINAT